MPTGPGVGLKNPGGVGTVTVIVVMLFIKDLRSPTNSVVVAATTSRLLVNPLLRMKPSELTSHSRNRSFCRELSDGPGHLRHCDYAKARSRPYHHRNIGHPGDGRGYCRHDDIGTCHKFEAG